MADLNTTDMTFLLIDITLVLAGLFTWAFWMLDQWRSRKDFFRRFDLLKVRERISR